MNGQNTNILSKEDILLKTGQGLLFYQWLIADLKMKSDGNSFHNCLNPFYEDTKASLSIFKNEAGTWCFKDFGSDEYQGDVFDFAAKHYRLNVHQDFKLVLKRMADDLGLFAAQSVSHIQNTVSALISKNLVKTKKLSDIDLAYWKQYGINQEILCLYKVMAVEYYTTKTGRRIYASDTSPIFVYEVAVNSFKIYQPAAENHKYLWVNKKPSYQNVFGVEQLPEWSESILITEGYKDCLTLAANGYNAVGLDNAQTKIDSDLIKTLKAKCKHLLLCLDIDQAGLKAAEKLSERHGLAVVRLPAELMQYQIGKDVSDYFKAALQGESYTKFQLSKDQFHALLKEAIAIWESSPQTKVNNTQKETKFHQTENYLNEKYDLRLNVVRNEIEYKVKHTELYSLLNENNLYVELQKAGIAIGFNNLMALLKSDFVPSYNPFINYFLNLPDWDGKDHISALANCVKASNQSRFRLQFKKWIVRVVACAINPKIHNKQALVLVHPKQNSGKTTFCRFLCPPKLKNYITENIGTDKDSKISLATNLLINLDELATLSKQDINHLKALFSRDFINERLPYDRKTSILERRASFIGSTNNMQFLSDDTGSVRWLCFEIESINWKYKDEVDIDMIYAQAYHLYKNEEFEYTLSVEEIEENETANLAYRVISSEYELISKYYEPGSKDDHDKLCNATDICLDLLDRTGGKIRLSSNIVGKKLQTLGFNRIKHTNGLYGYFIKFK